MLTNLTGESGGIIFSKLKSRLMNHLEHMSLHRLTKLLGVVFLIVLIATGGVFWLYSGKTSELKWSLLASLHLPVGKVGGSYMDANLVHEYSDLTSLLGSKVPALGNMLALEATAHGRVTVNHEALESTKKELETDELFQKIAKVRGDEFALNTIGRQYLLNTRLSTWYASQASLEPELGTRVKQAYADLGNDQSWASVASQMSDDTATKWFAGDTGYVDLSQAIPEYRDVVSRLPLNTLSIVYSRYGVHIVEVRERVKHEGVELTKLQEVLFRTQNFNSWLSKEMRGQVFSWYLQ